MIEQHPDTGGGFHVFVHRDPNLQFEADRLAEHRHQFLEAPGDVVLAAANSHPRPQRRELRKIAVAAKTKMVAGNLLRQWAQTLKRPGVPVEADQTVLLELCNGFGNAVPPSDNPDARRNRSRSCRCGARAVTSASGEPCGRRCPHRAATGLRCDCSAPAPGQSRDGSRESLRASAAAPRIRSSRWPRYGLCRDRCGRRSTRSGAAPPMPPPWLRHGRRVRAPPGWPSAPAASGRTATAQGLLRAHRYAARRSAGSAPAFSPHPTGCRRAPPPERCGTAPSRALSASYKNV